MKILGQLSPVATPLTMAISLLLAAGNLRASGPGGAGNTGNANGTATTGSVSGSASVAAGSHGTVVTNEGSRSPSSAPAASVTRPGVSFSNNAPRMSTGAFAQNSVGRTGAPASYLQGTRTGSASSERNANAWSGTAVVPAGNAAVRTSMNPLYSSNGYTNNRFAGRTSFPAWYNNGSGVNRDSPRGDRNGRRRYPYRYGYNPYAYGPAYAPYVGYYGGSEGAYPYYADGADADTADGDHPGTPTVSPQYTDQGQDANGDQQHPAPQNRNENGAAQSTLPNNGPDSLVEAVQQELIRRGYFAGRVDAIYGPDTKAALRKFQQDHQLADSGLINEATLHALQLD